MNKTLIPDQVHIDEISKRLWSGREIGKAAVMIEKIKASERSAYTGEQDRAKDCLRIDIFRFDGDSFAFFVSPTTCRFGVRSFDYVIEDRNEGAKISVGFAVKGAVRS
jgi:hypothetical protein